MRTIAELWEEQGFEKGVKAGEKRGEQRARAEGIRLLATTLRQVLKARFGALSRTTSERIARADAPRLAAWTARAATADKLGDVFARP